jgi:hypothetical protein
MENQFTQTSVIKLGNETGPLNNVLVEQNLFNGGGYAVYGGGTGSNISGIRFFNNHFVRKPEGFFENCGQHGPVVYYDASMPGNAWSGNVWHDGGAPVQP